MKRRFWIGLAAVAFLLLSFESALLLTGKRILISQELVRPGTDYFVPDYGNLKNNGQASLVCRYFTGRHLTNEVLWYSSNNVMGKDECPFLSQQEEKIGASDLGSLADWVSGIATVLATIVALTGYFWADNQRKREEKQRRQDSAYQIGYKLAALISDAVSTHRTLTPEGSTLEDWEHVTDPFVIVGAQQPIIGTRTSMTRSLTETEQNLLMSLREEDFLMRMDEADAQNASIIEGLAEYKTLHAAIMAKLPPPVAIEDQSATLALTTQEAKALFTYVTPASSLIQMLRKRSKENVETLKKLGKDFHPMMNKHWPDLHLHKIEETTEMAKTA